MVQWRQREDGGLELQHNHSLRQLTWHSRGGYFATVAPKGNTQVLRRGSTPAAWLMSQGSCSMQGCLQRHQARCQGSGLSIRGDRYAAVRGGSC